MLVNRGTVRDAEKVQYAIIAEIVRQCVGKDIINLYFCIVYAVGYSLSEQLGLSDVQAVFKRCFFSGLEPSPCLFLIAF